MILHIDMDAFYASVEQRDTPELKGKCVVVGGNAERGVVSAASYEARKYGVHSAMPIFQVRRICPGAVFVPPRMQRYKSVSREIMDILLTFSPLVEPVSIDEAFVDVTGCERYFGVPLEIARAVKEKIKADINLTCSVGGAPIKFLAKIASDMRKPDGLFIITPDQVPGFIAALPVGKVPGVGKRTGEQLGKLQIITLGDVTRYSRKHLVQRLGKFGDRLADLARGVDAAKVNPQRTIKSISSEITLSADTDDKGRLGTHMFRQAQEVARRLRKKKLRAKTVAIKIKYTDFRQFTRQATLKAPTQSADCLYRAAKKLLDAHSLAMTVRLVGLGAFGLQAAGTPMQMDLFSGPGKNEDRWEKVDCVMDEIEERFGKDCLKKARLVASKKT